jgi:peroxiredoxin
VTEAAPRIVDRYAIYDRLGAGGMGAVHFGRLVAPAGFSRTVAIKQLNPDRTSDPRAAARLREEARVAARIRHPNVVGTIDVVASDGDLFLVMEYVAGESLASLLSRMAKSDEPVPIAIATTIMAGVLHGLHAAHEATDEQGAPLGLVHRDVSPHNVLVGTDGIARILDFGVAKARGGQRHTEPGHAVGKRHYMPPEQLEGRRDLTRAVDVFAAGVVLWEIVAGRRLFTGAAPYGQMLGGASDPPSTHRWRRDGTVPEGEMRQMQRMDGIVMRAIDVDPARRYATARDLALALEESFAVASQSTVGAWVEALAKDVLLQRAARVAEIEKSSPTAVPTTAGDTPPRRARRGALRVGDTAPDIDAKTTRGDRFVLSQSEHRCSVVYFFPKAFTPGCTRETLLFRDSSAELGLSGAGVVGISTDDHKTQCAFAESVHANFPMIADEDGAVSRAYGVLWPIIARPKRVTFVIDRSLKILAVFRHELQIGKHRDEVLQFVDQLFRDRQDAGRG